jgi:hypothetical protein
MTRSVVRKASSLPILCVVPSQMQKKAATTTNSSRSQAKRGSPANSQASAVSTSSKGSLPTWILKQLAEDIEATGGLESLSKKTHKLSELLDKRYSTEINCGYGKKGTEQRKKIRNKVQRWKDKSAEKYLQELKRLGIVPFLERSVAAGPRRRSEGTAREASVEDLLGFESLTIKAPGKEEDESISDLEEDDLGKEPSLKRRKSQEVQELPRTMSSNNRVIRINPLEPGKKSGKIIVIGSKESLTHLPLNCCFIQVIKGKAYLPFKSPQWIVGAMNGLEAF